MTSRENIGDPDSEGSTLTRSTYTVTTPASYVYFEQTVTPSTGGRARLKESTRRRNTVSKDEMRFKQILKTKNFGPVGSNGIDRSFDSKKRQKPDFKTNSFEKIKGGDFGRLAINANDDHYYPNQENYFPGSGGGSYRPPNVGSVSTSYLPGGENLFITYIREAFQNKMPRL